jgi:acyl-CoA thioester hydrolase
MLCRSSARVSHPPPRAQINAHPSAVLKETVVIEADFSLPVRVYWEDTDAGGVVFYANYLKYFERARTEWLRALGVNQSDLQTDSDCIFVVAEVQLRYLSSARLDDLLTVTVRVLEKGKASLVLQQQAWREGTLLAEGQVRVGCVSATAMRPRRIPMEVWHKLGDREGSTSPS